jgi:predicted aminopeptidase
MIWKALLGLLGAATLYLTVTPTGRYIARAGWEEAKILRARQPIAALVNDPATPPATREKLRLVLAARQFAADSIGLRVKESFTEFTQLKTDTLVLVVSAAYRDRLKSHTWWFPVVGRVPYKGFFDYDAARREAQSLRERGLDPYVRPASAFSTLGWFNDPLLSTTLREDTLDLANTVIHEVTHNTFYAKGQAVFNESFANFVGARGAAWFFRSRGDSGAAAEVEARWADEKLMARFWESLYESVDSAYDSWHEDSTARRIEARDTVYARARQRLVHELGPQLRTIGPRTLERMRLDNAALMARRIYMTDLELFDRVWEKEGRDLKRAMTKLIELARSDEKKPFDGLRRYLGDPIPVDPDSLGSDP